MRRYLALWFGAAVTLLAVFVAEADADPANVLEVQKRIDAVRATHLESAAKTHAGYDGAAVEREQAEIAKAGIAGVEVDAVPVAEALAWARIFAAAGSGAKAIALAERFLAGQPNDADRFAAELLRLDELAKAGDGKRLAELVVKAKVPGDAEASQLTSSVTRRYVPVINKAIGLTDTLALVDRVYAGLPRLDAKVVAQTRLTAEKERRARANLPAIEDEAKQLATYEEQVRGSWGIRSLFFTQAKADLLVAAGRRDEAIKAFDGLIASLGDSNPRALRPAKSARAQLTLPGTPAPAIKVDDVLGQFTSLEALRGKVVLVDFFAHWCGPCRASFPDTRKLLAELGDQGLAVVGVTQYYGYLGQARNLTPAAEKEALAGFIKEQGITWPVVLTDADTFTAHGVQGIPQITVIDRKGTIRRIEVGYSAPTFAELRAEVEQLLRS